MKQNNRKQEILQQAAQLFKEKGYRAVSMRDLAEALDIKAASLYNHIQSKEEILSDIILEVAEEYAQAMQQIQKESISCIAKLKKLIALHIRIANKNSNAMAIVQKDWVHLEKEMTYYKQLRSDYESNFHKIIEEGIAAKEFKTANPETIAFSLLSTLNTLYLWIPKKSNLDIDQLKKELPILLLSGIAQDTTTD